MHQQPIDQFHVLSFEGPDPYARAGGIASRVSGLVDALAGAGVKPHLWFVGDPEQPGHEQRGGVMLHRWCQWISRYHPNGVYANEEGKRADYATSLPPYLIEHALVPSLSSGTHRAVVLAEEWHTADAVLRLDALLRELGLSKRVSIFWNANNTFGFDRIDWVRLQKAATIVTVSRYMRQCMRAYGVDALVIPNGLGPESYCQPAAEAVQEVRRRFEHRLLLAKVARWDPDKRWLLAVATVAELKRYGFAPLLVARGGIEAYEREVLGQARAHGLRITEHRTKPGGVRGLMEALSNTDHSDILVMRSHLDAESRGVLFRGADAVLANSSHEPFGLVGLEAMAVGGLACTGASGEDYAVDGQNALVLHRNDPREFISLFGRMRRSGATDALRQAAQLTAQQYAWPRVVDRCLLPRV